MDDVKFKIRQPHECGLKEMQGFGIFVLTNETRIQVFRMTPV